MMQFSKLILYPAWDTTVHGQSMVEGGVSELKGRKSIASFHSHE